MQYSVGDGRLLTMGVASKISVARGPEVTTVMLAARGGVNGDSEIAGRNESRGMYVIQMFARALSNISMHLNRQGRSTHHTVLHSSGAKRIEANSHTDLRGGRKPGADGARCSARRKADQDVKSTAMYRDQISVYDYYKTDLFACVSVLIPMQPVAPRRANCMYTNYEGSRLLGVLILTNYNARIQSTVRESKPGSHTCQRGTTCMVR